MTKIWMSSKCKYYDQMSMELAGFVTDSGYTIDNGNGRIMTKAHKLVGYNGKNPSPKAYALDGVTRLLTLKVQLHD